MNVIISSALLPKPVLGKDWFSSFYDHWFFRSKIFNFPLYGGIFFKNESCNPPQYSNLIIRLK